MNIALAYDIISKRNPPMSKIQWSQPYPKPSSCFIFHTISEITWESTLSSIFLSDSFIRSNHLCASELLFPFMPGSNDRPDYDLSNIHVYNRMQVLSISFDLWVVFKRVYQSNKLAEEYKNWMYSLRRSQWLLLEVSVWDKIVSF